MCETCARVCVRVGVRVRACAPAVCACVHARICHSMVSSKEVNVNYFIHVLDLQCMLSFILVVPKEVINNP